MAVKQFADMKCYILTNFLNVLIILPALNLNILLIPLTPDFPKEEIPTLLACAFIDISLYKQSPIPYTAESGTNTIN